MEEKAQPAPLTAISNALIHEELGKALFATAKLMLHNIRYMEAGTKDYTIAVTNLGKLLIDMKKSEPKESVDKEAIMKEIEEWLTRGRDDS